MERRMFLKSGVGTTALVLAGPSLLVLEGCDWIATVEEDVPIAQGIVNSIVEIIGTATGNGVLAGTVASLLAAAAQALLAGLGALNDAVNAYKAAKSQGTLAALAAAATAVQNDVAKFVAALPPGTVSTTIMTAIVGGIGLVISIINSIAALIQNAQPATPASLKAQVKGMTPKTVAPSGASIKISFNITLIHCGFPQFQLQ